MRCVTDPDPETLLDRVEPFLRRDPVGHNLAYTIILLRRDGRVPVEPDAQWLRVVDADGTPAGVALRTPPMPLLLTDAPPDAVDAVFAHVLAAGPAPPAVSGPTGAVDRFVARWRATGGTAVPTVRQRLFRMGAVTAPDGVVGRPRLAVRSERDLVAEWLAAFQAEATPQSPPSDAEAQADRLIADDRLQVWEVDGAPVSMLAVTPPAAGVVRIYAVYTPPEHRRRGYAGACVAAASRWVLDCGASECVLYTDLANPTSNRIYQAVGYRPVGDAATWHLTSP